MAPRSKGWYWICLIALVAGLVLYASERDFPGLYEGYTESTLELETLGNHAERLERDKLKLEHKIMGLDTNSVVQESAIRKNTGHVRDGETIYHVELPKEK